MLDVFKPPSKFFQIYFKTSKSRRLILKLPALKDFDANGYVFAANGRVGLEVRNIFKGDHFRSIDARISRKVHFTEKAKVEFIAEAFNIFNTLNVRFFNTVYGDSIFNPPGTPGTFFDGARNPSYGAPRAIL